MLRSEAATLTVLHVSQPTEAGVANVCAAQLQDQVSRGWAVHLACPAGSGPLARQAVAMGVKVHPWKATRSPGSSAVREVIRLKRIVTVVRPDVVVLHSSKAGLAGRLSVRGSLPTIFMPHSWSFEAVGGPVGFLSQLWERAAARWTSVTVCVSESERETGRRAKVGGETVVIPNGVDLRRWDARDREEARAVAGVDMDTPLAVCVGRLAPQKGQDVLLRAWPAICQEAPGAHLVIVGDGPSRASLMSLAGDDDTISFVGACDPAPWFACSDLVVLPSRWEGMPLVALEAMSSGRCVVGTEVSGMREALGEGRPLVAVEDGPALAREVAVKLRDRKAAWAEGMANRRRAVDLFAQSRATDAMADLVMQTARGHGLGSSVRAGHGAGPRRR